MPVEIIFAVVENGPGVDVGSNRGKVGVNGGITWRPYGAADELGL